MKPRIVALAFGLGVATLSFTMSAAVPALATDLDDVLQFQRSDVGEMQKDRDAAGMKDAQDNVRAYQQLLYRQQHAAPVQGHPAPTHHAS